MLNVYHLSEYDTRLWNRSAATWQLKLLKMRILFSSQDCMRVNERKRVINAMINWLKVEHPPLLNQQLLELLPNKPGGRAMEIS